MNRRGAVEEAGEVARDEAAEAMASDAAVLGGQAVGIVQGIGERSRSPTSGRTGAPLVRVAELRAMSIAVCSSGVSGRLSVVLVSAPTAAWRRRHPVASQVTARRRDHGRRRRRRRVRLRRGRGTPLRGAQRRLGGEGVGACGESGEPRGRARRTELAAVLRRALLRWLRMPPASARAVGSGPQRRAPWLARGVACGRGVTPVGVPRSTS